MCIQNNKIKIIPDQRAEGDENKNIQTPPQHFEKKGDYNSPILS